MASTVCVRRRRAMWCHHHLCRMTQNITSCDEKELYCKSILTTPFHLNITCIDMHKWPESLFFADTSLLPAEHF